MPGTLEFSENFANLTAWTTSGTVSVASNECLITPASSGLNAVGLIKTAAIQPNGYWSFKIDYKPSTLTDCNFWLGICLQNTLAYANSAGIYISGNSGETYALDSGVNVLDSAYSTVADWQELYVEILGNDYCRLYLEGDLVYTTFNIGSGFNVCDSDIYIACGCDKVNGSSGTLYLRDIEVYNNRLISVENDTVEVATVDMGVEVYSDTGLSGGTSYSYRVRKAFGDVNYEGLGYSDYSNTEVASTDAASNDDGSDMLMVDSSMGGC